MSELQRLRDRIEQLEQVLGVDRLLINRIRGALQVTKDQAKMLGVLISRNVVTHESMFILVYGARPDCDQPEMKILDVQLCKLRARLKPSNINIKTIWGEGWQMAPEDKAKVRRLIDSDDIRQFLPERAA